MPFQASYESHYSKNIITNIPKVLSKLKLVHTEYQVNHKTQWIKVVHLVPNVQTLARQDIGAIRLAPTTTLHFDTVLKTKYSFPHWIFQSLLK